jgi:hypothetical protein
MANALRILKTFRLLDQTERQYEVALSDVRDKVWSNSAVTLRKRAELEEAQALLDKASAAFEAELAAFIEAQS